MKNLKTLPLLIIILGTISCSNIESQLASSQSNSLISKQNLNNIQLVDTNNSLSCKWKLIHLYGGFAGFNITFIPGIVTWKFNLAAQTFTVINNNTTEPWSYLPSGTYPCTITTNPNGTFCFTYGQLTGCSNLNSNQLELSENVAADGIGLSFIH
jgi:DNA-binding beta-propeller fold protein YncE